MGYQNLFKITLAVDCNQLKNQKTKKSQKYIILFYNSMFFWLFDKRLSFLNLNTFIVASYKNYKGL